MTYLYNLSIRIYVVFITLAAPFYPKARLWVKGRRHWFTKLKQTFHANKPVIWIHAASLGEFEQGRPLIEKLKKDNKYFILLTFFSPSGYEIRKNYTVADYVCYLPADSPGNAKKFIGTVSPALVYFVKYEFWRNYLKYLKKNSIPVFLISAIFRENQIFFRWYGAFFKNVLHFFQHIFVQDKNSKELLQNKGITNVTVSGDTRFDRVFEIKGNVNKYPKIQEFRGDRLTLIAGSSWEPDENMVITYWKENPDKLKLILAPHETHPGNINRIKSLVGERHILFSELENKSIENKDVLIVDTIGHLSALYQYGQIAFIGGGFGKGIHNTLEAATFGLPVLFGPNHQRFREAMELIEKGGAFPVKNYQEFRTTINNIIGNPESLKKASQICKGYVQSNTGATAVILKKTLQDAD